MQQNIIDVFLSQCEDHLRPDGIAFTILVWEQEEHFNICLVDGDSDDVTKLAMDALFFKGGMRAIWGIGRVNKDPDACGIDTEQFLTVFYFDDGWQYGVLPYRYEPRMVGAIDWRNVFWLPIMEKEVINFFEKSFHLRDTHG